MAHAARFVAKWLAIPVALTMALMSHAAAIIGGESAPLQTYPFMVSLIEHAAPVGQESEFHFCGGTLIAPQWVLTAANCVYFRLRQQTPEEIDLYLGSNDFANGDRIRPAQFFVHPQYDRVRGENDIALIRLPRPPRADLAVASTPLKFSTDPRLEDSSSTRPVKAIGWGPMDYAGSASSPDLRAVELQLRWKVMACPFDESALTARWTDVSKALRELRISPETEGELFRRVAAAVPPLIPPHSLCTGGAVSALTQEMISRGSLNSRGMARPGPCTTDAGGPLIGTNPDGSAVQLGIVSFPFGYEGQHCDSVAYPPYYVSVGAYADWIAAVVSDH
ncbi:MAG: serine protease [Rhodopseudomonas sp.]|uniref:S1 family peptidase n=1 Tax=Rhodopseudomonas sp. TaxID=1078 RepID=UPI00185AB126|nr:serine protease [Rhodopseudomonas sp.]NVN88277.1 serine protease [Rhodopseudomonas sp.]